MFEHFQHVNQHLSLAKVEPPYLSTTSCIRFILIVISPLFQLSLGDDNVITINFAILQYHDYSSSLNDSSHTSNASTHLSGSSLTASLSWI